MKLLFLLFSLLLLSHGATSSSDEEPVLDSDGDVLKAGQLYYAISQFCEAHGGGLELVSLESLDKSYCPLYAARASPPDDLGQPLAFIPRDPRNDTIKEGTELYIMFVVPTVCSESTVWHYNMTGDYVTTGGATVPVRGPNFSRFALNKQSGKVYGIRPFPPGLPRFDNLGLDVVNGKQLLRVKNNYPGGVIFQKATKKSTIPSVVGGSEA